MCIVNYIYTVNPKLIIKKPLYVEITLCYFIDNTGKITRPQKTKTNKKIYIDPATRRLRIIDVRSDTQAGGPWPLHH